MGLYHQSSTNQVGGNCLSIINSTSLHNYRTLCLKVMRKGREGREEKSHLYRSHSKEQRANLCRIELKVIRGSNMRRKNSVTKLYFAYSSYWNTATLTDLLRKVIHAEEGCWKVIFQNFGQQNSTIKQRFFHCRIFFHGRTRSPCFDLFICWVIKQITQT